MGNLYFATSDSGQKVIIKSPKFSGDSKDPVMLQKIKIEAQILSSLHHDHIVEYIDERDDGENFFLVIEYLEGRNLLDQYKEKPADEQTAKDHVETLLGILEYLHGSPNIIHRDINPKNIMTDPDRRVVLIDFGAAKHGYVQILANPEDGSGSHTLIGTQGYSAPEQFTTGEVTPASDIYGVGATLFYLLTCKNPRRYMASGGGLTRSPQDVNPTIGRDISDIVKKAMSEEPKDRYQTATDMISALNGMETILEAPHIIFQGRKYLIKDKLEIGRAHDCQDSECRQGGRFFHRKNVSPIDVMVYDDQHYLSKHHARVLKDSSGGYWVEDLGSRNHTALSNDGGISFTILKPGKKEQLKDGDIVATVYNTIKGAYMTFMFRG